VRDSIPYYLDEWNVGAEEVLQKGWGMCAGKALLAAEMHQAAGIAARFKVLKIMGEEALFSFAQRWMEAQRLSAEDKQSLLNSFRSLPPERDHIIVQVLIDNQWQDLDPARDEALDQGMRLIGLWRERRVLSQEGYYGSLDGWLEGRLKRRSVIRNRPLFFQIVNQQMEKMRQVSRVARKAGLSGWTDAQVRESLKNWDMLPALAGLPEVQGVEEFAREARASLSKIEKPESRSAFESQLLDWLYALARHNIKRGRVWELSDVLTQHRADCLGYARLLSFITKEFGLDSGVVEVIQDICRRYVPHYVCLVNLANGGKRLLDPWYGSADIRHRILAACLPGQPLPHQFTMKALQQAERIGGLAPEQVAGLSFYILGNSHLAQGEAAQAVECYDISLWLYADNPRTLFNRAIALETLDKVEQAREDYRHAFSIPSSLMRLMATVEHIEPLIELDEKSVDELNQQVYLLRHGFITGRQERWAEVAKICSLTPTEARKSYDLTLVKLGEPERA
jgi:tetratricopeptide (TPR) repeat protein